jgi:hypothetical protein
MREKQNDEKQNLVVAPGGRRPKDQVHAVSPDQLIRRSKAGTYDVTTKKQSVAPERTSIVPERMVLTPGGYRPASRVHRIEPNQKLQMLADRIVKIDLSGATVHDLGTISQRPAHLPLMPRHVSRSLAKIPALGEGWISYASWTNTTGTPVSSFTTTWTVPAAPISHSGQTIFLFNGIQNGTMIYQPVLQWGGSAAGGGEFWSVASWFADGQGGSAFFSTLVQVNPGDVLIGVMTLTSQSAAGFSYNCEFQGIANTSLAISDVQELTWCIETLEAYGVNSASDYPAADDTAMTSIEILTGTAPARHPVLNWTNVDAVTDVGQHTIVVSNSNPNGEVDIFYTDSPTNMFVPVYAQGDPGNGIGNYDLRSPADQAFAFDYDSSGKLDHLGLYRPGTGTIWILNNNAGAFTPVYAQGDPGNGIGNYDLKSGLDRAFAFDYDSSGKLDHLALYRPGTGTIWILNNNAGAFTPVYAQGDPGNGIGNYDLRSPADQAFAFDYDSSGKLDHLALYRPGTGTIWILQNAGGTFSAVYAQGDPGNGIGGYDLKSSLDRAFAFDYDSSGKLDHLVLYRPGTGTIWILRNSAGAFTPVYAQGDPGNGIGNYDLKSGADRLFAFDYDSSGKLDHLALYRPGTGTIWIQQNKGGSFSKVYAQGDPGRGIGGYDLRASRDRTFAFDYNSSGKLDHLVLYRPGTGTIWIVKKT